MGKVRAGAGLGGAAFGLPTTRGTRAFLPCCVWVMVARAKRTMPKGCRSWSEWVMRPEPKRRGFERDGRRRGLEAVARKHGGPLRATCNAKTVAMYQCHAGTCTTALQLSTKLCTVQDTYLSVQTLGKRAENRGSDEVHMPLFTQPAPQGRPSRFSSHRKGAGLPHPIKGGVSGLQS